MDEDMNRQLMLDGNAAAGLLASIFGVEMTDAMSECASCGNVAQVGSMLLFGHTMGMVLRCSVCENVIMRIAETPEGIYLDARGAVHLRLGRRAR